MNHWQSERLYVRPIEFPGDDQAVLQILGDWPAMAVRESHLASINCRAWANKNQYVDFPATASSAFYCTQAICRLDDDEVVGISRAMCVGGEMRQAQGKSPLITWDTLTVAFSQEHRGQGYYSEFTRSQYRWLVRHCGIELVEFDVMAGELSGGVTHQLNKHEGRVAKETRAGSAGALKHYELTAAELETGFTNKPHRDGLAEPAIVFYPEV